MEAKFGRVRYLIFESYTARTIEQCLVCEKTNYVITLNNNEKIKKNNLLKLYVHKTHITHMYNCYTLCFISNSQQ